MESDNVERNRMIKKFTFPLIFILLLSCAGTPNLSEQEGNAIAVWNVERLSPMPGLPDLGELFSDQIIQTLNKSGNWRVIERKSLHLALQELNLAPWPMNRPASVWEKSWVPDGWSSGDILRQEVRCVSICV